jgi:MFS family permease
MEKRSQNLLVLGATVFVFYTGFAFLLPFLPLYLVELGVRDEVAAARWAGLLIGIAPLIAGLLAPFWGRLGDLYGLKPVIVIALLASAILLALSAGARTPGELLAFRIGTGLFGGVGPLALALASSLGQSSSAGGAIGLVQGAQILAAAVGPILGGVLADARGIRPTFLLAGGLLLAAALLVLALLEAGRPAPREAKGAHPPLGRPALALVGVLFMVNFVGKSFTPILPLQLESLGVGHGRISSSAGILISAYSVAAATSAVLLGRASRALAPTLLLPGSLLAGGLALVPMAFVSTLAAFIGLAVVLGLTSGGALTLCYTVGGELSPKGSRATAFGIFSGAALFGGSVSPSVAGYLARWGFRGIYFLDAAIFLGVGGLLLFGHVLRREILAPGHPGGSVST